MNRAAPLFLAVPARVMALLSIATFFLLVVSVRGDVQGPAVAIIDKMTVQIVSEESHMLDVKNVSVPDTCFNVQNSLDDARLEIGLQGRGDFVEQNYDISGLARIENAEVVREWADPRPIVASYVSMEDMVICAGVNVERRCESEIFQGNAYFRAIALNVVNNRVARTDVGPQLASGSLFGQFPLLLACIPQFIGATFESVSESGDGDGRDSRPEFSMSDRVYNFQERDIEGVVWLTLLGCAVLACFAYVKVDGMKYKKADNQKDDRDSRPDAER